MLTDADRQEIERVADERFAFNVRRVKAGIMPGLTPDLNPFNHANLSNLDWPNSGHTSIAKTVAGFDDLVPGEPVAIPFQGSPGGGDEIPAANDSRFPTDDEKAALAGTDGSPSGTNKYVTDSDPRL